MRLRLTMLLALAASAVALAPAAHADTYTRGDLAAHFDAQKITLTNGLLTRTWDRTALTSAITAHDGQAVSTTSPDFTLTFAGQNMPSTEFRAADIALSDTKNDGMRVTMSLIHKTIPTLTAKRVVEVYPGVAGFRSQTTLYSPVPLVLSAATIDQTAVGANALPTIHAFRAGADWRGESNWTGPEFGSVGDAHAGDWRATSTGVRGAALAAPGEWISAGLAGTRTVFQVMERNDFPSSRALYDGAMASTRVDFTRDIISLGPLEESGHVENPRDENAGRGRTITAAGLELPAAFTGVGRDAEDEGWQFHKYLVEHRIEPYPHDVVFNSDATDGNVISTGAKDDMDFKTVQKVAPVARRMGADVFTLDDGWQAASGDWYPDSPDHRDPRVNDPTYQGDKSKLPPRFPDADFRAVREAIAPMKLGLWWTPLNFNPGADVYKAHPNWACNPTGQGFAAYSASDPDSSSNEAGLGIWSTDYFPHLEKRLRVAIEDWKVRLFKFDFIAWVDCPGVNDLYESHDRFLALIDELRIDYPYVAFAIDETNDYRLFPFESVLRGPSWFTNGGPTVAQVLHNTWTMSPWIPAFALGQKMLTGSQRNGHPVSTAVASTLLNEQMITEDLRNPAFEAIADEARPWIDWGKAHRDDLTGVVYPLLDDPLDGKKWTALQSWNPETARGALLAFRQDDDRDSISIGLKNVPDGNYQVRAAPDDKMVGVFTAAELRDGLTVELPKRGARVLLVKRVG